MYVLKEHFKMDKIAQDVLSSNIYNIFIKIKYINKLINISGCDTCKNSSLCDICDAKHFQQNGQCTSKCQEGYFCNFKKKKKLKNNKRQIQQLIKLMFLMCRKVRNM